ncbi:MAG: phosphopentomutase [Thermoleophilia bacterium]|nr:phosphopentomutase [Thermoleophilia bacterium]
MRRFIFLMLDGVGVGALPDAKEYGDEDSDTLGNLCRTLRVRLPNLQAMGLGNIIPLQGIPPVQNPLALPGRLAPLSSGKDTTVGHWEHMGLVTSRPFPTYPDGFPAEVIQAFTERIGRGVLGNKPASGTAIIEELGETHMAAGEPIVYTSADSVFQIAAHIDVVPLDQLYRWCEVAREILVGPHAVARVIARPFTGKPGHFVRTKDRRDFSLAPPEPTYLDLLSQAGIPVLALGKVAEIFGGRGITNALKVGSNQENLNMVRDLVWRRAPHTAFTQGLLFTNLVDFDMLWGHRNDVEGFANGLEAVDSTLPDILEGLGPEDMLLITADHGVDPTTPSTDHSREYVFFLLYPRPQEAPDAVYEGTFSDTGATVYHWLVGDFPPLEGKSILDLDPPRGFRGYTPVARLRAGRGTSGSQVPSIPCRVGPEEAAQSAAWLASTLGEPPKIAVFLGSGLTVDWSYPVLAEVSYQNIPHWRSSKVKGHPGQLQVLELERGRVALVKGRVHEYEGYDLGEAQLAFRSLVLWGVTHFVVTSAAGAVDPTLVAGEIVVVDQVLDLKHFDPEAGPALLPATSPVFLDRLGPELYSMGKKPRVHAAVPGPQYETPAELAVLRYLGAATVSMSLDGEALAAVDYPVEAAFLAVVTNAGKTQHDEVLAQAAQAKRGLTRLVDNLVAGILET